jgi:DNA-binding transcriptional regulator YdaS (Cro superfamily)
MLLTSRKLAQKLGRDPSTVSRWFSGMRAISPIDARLLEAATGVPRLAWLYPDEFNNPYMPRRGAKAKSAES